MTTLDLLRQHNVDVRTEGHEHCRPGWAQMDCPQCGQHKHYRLGLNLRRGHFHCWSCGGLQVKKVIHLLTGLSWKVIDTLDLARPVVGEEPDLRGKLVMPVISEFSPCHRDFIKARGFSPTNLRMLWGVGGTGQLPRYAWRLVIPIVYRGEVVSFTTRAIDESQKPRYLSASPGEEKYDHRELLYGHDLADGGSIVVVEGPLDVWALGRGAVATFGTAFTTAQVRKIAKYPRRVICFDNETNAQRQAQKLVQSLSAFPGETINVRMETGKDPSRSSKEEVAHLKETYLA